MAQAGQHGSIVTLLCDSGERYASTCFNDAWLAQRGLDIADEEARITAFLATGNIDGSATNGTPYLPWPDPRGCAQRQRNLRP
jgi:hypothetical protein